MKTTKKCLSFVIFVLISVTAVIGFTSRVSYLGYSIVNQSSGSNYNGTFTVNSSVYDAASGGSLLYAQSNSSITILDGTFGMILTGLTGIDFSQDLWVQTKIGGDTLSPRLELVSVPQAIYANQSGFWDGYDSPTGWDLDSSNDITTANIADQNVNGSEYLGGYAESEFQRVLDNCSAGESIREVLQDGTVVCEEDTDTNTNAANICSGDQVYLDGEGNCDTLDELGDFDNDVGFFSDLDNFTGTLTPLKFCLYNGELTEFYCTVDMAVSELANDLGFYSAVSNFSSSLEDTHNHSCHNITGAASDLCTITDTDTTYSALSEFTNDLGFWNNNENISSFVNVSCDARDSDTTYSALSEFTNDLGFYNSPGNLTNKAIITYQNISNLPTCSGTDKLTYDGTTLSCESDETGGGGSGGDKWVDGGSYIYPNSTYAANVAVWGSLSATDWTNASAYINASCDARDTDTTYSLLSEFGNDLGFWNDNENISSFVNASCDARDSDTTYSALSEFSNDLGFYNAVSNFSSSLEDTHNHSCHNITGAASDLCTITDTDTTYSTLSEFDNDVGFYSAFSNFSSTSVAEFVNRSTWTSIDDYPAQCGSGFLVRGLGDMLVCQEVQDLIWGPTYIATTTNIVVTYNDDPDNTVDLEVPDMRNTTADMIKAVNNSGELNVNITGFSRDLSCTDCIGGTEIAELADADVSDTLTASSWDSETSQADLNVNSTNYWDALDSPSDINAADITDDDTYALTASAETFDENIAFLKNITQGDNDYHCFGDSNDACVWWNGTALIIS